MIALWTLNLLRDYNAYCVEFHFKAREGTFSRILNIFFSFFSRLALYRGLYGALPQDMSTQNLWMWPYLEKDLCKNHPGLYSWAVNPMTSVPFFKKWGIIEYNISVRCIASFDICLYCKMTAICLVNVHHIHSYRIFFLVMKTSKIYSQQLSNIQYSIINL